MVKHCGAFRALCVLALASVAATSAGCKRGVEVTYASYEDCILGKLGRGQSTVASEAIIAACHAKFPRRTIDPSKVRWDANAEPPIENGAQSGGQFHGRACTQDCSGHKAGYEWAREHGILDAAYCDGDSDSFVDGCMSWVSEQAP